MGLSCACGNSTDSAGLRLNNSTLIKDGQRFVSVVLGFLWMNDEQLGFDPTIKTSDGERYIEIERDGKTERIIIDALIKRAPCVAGRATTCWKGHLEGDDFDETPGHQGFVAVPGA